MHRFLWPVLGVVSLVFVPACDCAGPTTVDGGPDAVTDAAPVDGGDVGPIPDAPRDAPRPDTGPCTPTGAETCDDVDNDCDGMFDEGVTRACGSDVGECMAGTETCVAGAYGACTGEVGPAPSEACNGLDDTCDGSIDEGCTCTDGTTQPCGSDVGECMEGTQTCAGGTWGTCAGEVGPATEACNGLDDSCDGTIDEGCSCVDGATQPCGSDVGECVAGTQTCASGTWGSCTGETTSVPELCNTLDDDCDGMTDEAFVLGGACDGADADLCAEGVVACDSTGGASCNDTTADSVEVCNAMDDDCDMVVDDGFMIGTACDGPDADLCNEGAFMCDAAGGSTCSDTSGASVEICNGMDDDCDGSTDEGNPGGGVLCAGAMDVGACISRTACVGGALICRGTFVGPGGSPTNPGTPAAPLSSITAAIANAGILGGGADVCVCDTSAAGASTFTEDVTMVEGTSVLGGYDCTSWTVTAGRVTAIQDVDDDGVSFPAGITSVTALDRMTVDGFDRAGASSQTSAITVTNASPALSGLTVRAGDAATAIGLRVVETAGTAAPVVTGGSYGAAGVAGGTAIAVRLEGASPTFNTTTIGGAGLGMVLVLPTTSYGVRCTDCGGTRFTGGSVASGGATTTAYGLHGTGALAGLSATSTSFGGGSTSTNGSSSTGVRLDACTGAPTFTGTPTNGGFSSAGVLTSSTRTAISVSGAGCAPVIDGARHVGCERGNTCIGIECSSSAACVVRNASLIQGTLGLADTAAHGMRCLSGGCASIATSSIAPGSLSGAASIGSGLDLDGSSPSVDDCVIGAPTGSSSVAYPAGRYDAVFFDASASILSNSILRDAAAAGSAGFNQLITVVRYDQAPTSGGARGPTVVNDVVEYAGCPTCGPRIGLFVNNPSPAGGTPSGIVRNTIVRHVGVGGVTNPATEANVASDWLFFQNDALWDPTATGGALYLDEGATALSTAMAINTLMMGGTSGGNLVADCMLTAAYRLPAASMCRNAGTAMSCPATDFDAQARPNEAVCDVGADEFYP